MDERAQTQIDFAIGISVFLLVLIGILLFLPDVFAAYEDPVGADEQEEADRIAATLVHEHRLAGNERTLWLDGSGNLSSAVRDDFQSVRDGAGVPSYRRVNVTVIDGGSPSEIVDSAGGPVVTDRNYDEQPAATAVRIIRFDDPTVCTPLCRIVVRVW
jgi:hypothetical protein